MFQSITSQLPMIQRIITILIIFILFDTYAFQAIRTLSSSLSLPVRRTVVISYWLISVAFYTLFVLTITGQFVNASKGFIVFITGLFFAVILAKIFMVVPLLIEDVYRIFNKIYTLIAGSKPDGGEGNSGFFISRKRFISQVSAGIGGLTFAGLGYGVMKGAHNYKLHKVTIGLKNLPAAFNGIKVGHISDIHSGSFWDMRAVEKGVDLLMAQKPDVIFFTGDLVNNIADEMTDDYIRIFSKIKAPMGVYSCLGNHDYGDYYTWPDKNSDDFVRTASNKGHMSPMQMANLEKLMGVHKQMGWDLLMNENRILERDGEKIAILGIENFGAKGRFPKYGKMKEAHAGTEGIATKLLLSHDPSHWEYEVLKKYPDVNIMFAGHTHGAQFGIETANFQWSPVKYMYKQWAGVYKQNEQFLYVNRGFGYLGYPGRLGIRPDVSVLTLTNG